MGLQAPLIGLMILAGAEPRAPDAFAVAVRPVLAKYCIGCHGGAKPRGRLDLARFHDEPAALAERKIWQEAAKLLRAREMPPENKPQPSAAERQSIIDWIDHRLAGAGTAPLQHDPGRVTLRRLNRVEYNNTIRDLVGVQLRPADDFPADDVGYGFDNIGDVLSLPPLLLEKYLAAADEILARVFEQPEIRRRILAGHDSAQLTRDAARQVLESFAARAYRRPVRGVEIDRLVRFVELARKNGESWEAGVRLALKAALVSPYFLFRVELDAEGGDASEVRQLNEFELASRLSFFLWSSMPDEELFALARRSGLRKELEKQVRRMLRDPKAQALVENFAGQWLQTRNLQTAAPDPTLFPNFNDALRSAMLQETETFFAAIMKEDRSVLDFLAADFTFLNERLAKHYGIAGVKGEEFRRVSLTGGQRGGVLTQASILTITSNPTRTSPVKRGKWIMENILGTPPPPPPPDAGRLDEAKKTVDSGSLRKRMEQHRTNPNCASCHARMDPLGFGFENFNAIGGWRDKDGKFPIDASGELPGGKSFRGPVELKTILKAKTDAFCRCLTDRMLTYALGRGLESYDQPAVDQIAVALAADNYRFSRLVLEIVNSQPFQMRRSKAR